MKKLILLFVIVLSFLFVLGVFSVSRLLEVPDQVLSEPVEHIEKISGLEFPADAKLLYREEADRGVSSIFIWRIIYTKSEFTNKPEKIMTIKSQDAFLSLRADLKNKGVDVGHSVEFFLASRWTNKGGEWDGVWVETSNGYYLKLKQIIRNENFSDNKKS
ncbi:MAG: hypothetical protein L3J98_05725 [Gammaproteobacteria bacterium]|nr:hypothetical protein [Gammaproteobacteria bacterium]MCF6259647.1 hypothetical protein [Gammaproteobacteria bacterium]